MRIFLVWVLLAPEITFFLGDPTFLVLIITQSGIGTAALLYVV